MHEQNASYWVKHSGLGAQNLNKICPKIVEKVLKWPLQYVNFQKFSGEACPRTSLDPFFHLKMLQNNFTGKNCA